MERNEDLQSHPQMRKGDPGASALSHAPSTQPLQEDAADLQATSSKSQKQATVEITVGDQEDVDFMISSLKSMLENRMRTGTYKVKITLDWSSTRS